MDRKIYKSKRSIRNKNIEPVSLKALVRKGKNRSEKPTEPFFDVISTLRKPQIRFIPTRVWFYFFLVLSFLFQSQTANTKSSVEPATFWCLHSLQLRQKSPCWLFTSRLNHQRIRHLSIARRNIKSLGCAGAE